MKVVAAIDSFKGCATSAEINQAVLSKLNPAIWQEKVNVPIADGGEGTIAAIQAALGGEEVRVESVDPLLRKIQGSYLLTTIENKKTAIIESATFIGIDLVEVSDKTVRQATSYGLGVAVADALQKVEQIYVTLGGSATSDGGLGMLQALGGKIVPNTTGNLLLTVEDIDLREVREKFKHVSLHVLADVTNEYCGSRSFANVFARQKGASSQTIKKMEQQANKVLQLVEKQGYLGNLSGTGAAGGLGGAFTWLGGNILSGFTTIQQLIGLETIIQDADLIFTGEGKLDAQTAQGKVPFGVANLAKKYHVPVIAVCGSRENYLGKMEELVLGAFSIQQGPISLEKAMEKQRTLSNLATLAKEVVQVFQYEKDK
ncbi:glycerate kinase [Enterococcus saccharolyticus]|uniref:Glycerate kinase n=1 Tax=Candidatus Enterococcus willemsii TaxID=1857215 RepID=A0ABQ6Z123_9ENTE|nr:MULTISPECIES: glycerate kinase [Enterococcus]KAF1304596.1 glycerate kinase [Enterococcus sp. CU12B]MCD5001331.1 glycerate kinase [Enterococcus saccharolyticus]